jgi:HAD superfamily hydrolase (TIGR01490 family)
VDPETHNRQSDLFYKQYQLGELDIDAYLAFACSVLTKFSMDELLTFRSEFIEEVIKPLILPQARQLIARHLDAGDYPMVITSTIEFVTSPIVELLCIQTLIAPVPEIIDNRYTGNITGTPSFAEGKVTRLKQWLDENNENLSGSYFYSDSHNDLPLLRLVDHPVAVDPDDKLRVTAEENNWQIISLRGQA